MLLSERWTYLRILDIDTRNPTSAQHQDPPRPAAPEVVKFSGGWGKGGGAPARNLTWRRAGYEEAGAAGGEEQREEVPEWSAATRDAEQCRDSAPISTRGQLYSGSEVA